MDAARPRYRTAIAAASLVLGPTLMSVGDLVHPAETWDAGAQVAILAQSASRWYAAHLLLFIGLLILVPGILALTQLAAERRPTAGYAARLLMVASVGALSAVFVFEMLLGRFLSDGADQAAASALLRTFQSPGIFPALMPGLLAFFAGTALFVAPLASAAGPFRWPALAFALGAALILGEIVSAEVLLSKIGNVVILVAGSAFAWVLLRDRQAAPAQP
jgi:hypothetical protein